MSLTIPCQWLNYFQSLFVLMWVDGHRRERRNRDKENGEVEKPREKHRDKEKSHRSKDEVRIAKSLLHFSLRYFLSSRNPREGNRSLKYHCAIVFGSMKIGKGDIDDTGMMTTMESMYESNVIGLFSRNTSCWFLLFVLQSHESWASNYPK